MGKYRKTIFFFIIFFFTIILSYIYSEKILKISLEKIFSKWLKREVIISKISNSFKDKKLILNKIIIKNRNGETKNLLESKNIIIEYEISHTFRKIFFIKKLIVEDVKLIIEIFKINEKVFKDNIDVAEKITLNKSDKIWPKKFLDFNFIIEEVNLVNLSININSNFKNKKHKVTFGKMKFFNVGNYKKSKHYKDVLKDIITFAVFSLDDVEFKEQINKIYKIN